ncbi:MAG: tRNA lysidine(34) synthetase TilS C-terminal domain-containing protein, partial [Planctomycetota bacterium]
GLKSEKKIGKFLTAQRIPHRLREKVLIVADSDKTIWVCPLRLSESAKITTRTRSVLQLRMTILERRQNSVDAVAPGQ